MVDTVLCQSIYGNAVLIPREKLEFRPSVYAIIVHEGRMLLVKSRSSGLLALPGGGVDLGEPMGEALKREVREETGIEVAVNSSLLHFSEQFFYYDPKDEAFHSFLFVFACTPLSFDMVSNAEVNDEETIEPRWYDIDDLKAEQFQIFGNFVVDYLKQQ